jgi:hypothetical protein
VTENPSPQGGKTIRVEPRLPQGGKTRLGLNGP